MFKRKPSKEAAGEAEPLTVFPGQQNFWTGGVFRLLGSGIRYYKLAFFNVKVWQRLQGRLAVISSNWPAETCSLPLGVRAGHVCGGLDLHSKPPGP